MNEIVKANMGTLPERMQYAKALAESDLLPDAYRRKPGNVLLAVEYGNALNVPPMTAIQGIHVIKGKPTLSADLMAALVRRAGHRLRVRVEDGPAAVAELTRSDDPDFTFRTRWDVPRAKKAGLLDTAGDNWTRHTAAMLKARAISEVAREGASDVLHGMIYTAEEMGATVDGDGAVTSNPDSADDVVDAEIVEDHDPVVVAAKRGVVEAWQLHRGEFDPEAAAGVFAAWSSGEILADAPAERLDEFAAWLASTTEDGDKEAADVGT